MRCDTCANEVPEVRRVLIDAGYDRTLSKAIYNCPDCFEKKEAGKKRQSRET